MSSNPVVCFVVGVIIIGLVGGGLYGLCFGLTIVFDAMDLESKRLFASGLLVGLLSYFVGYGCLAARGK